MLQAESVRLFASTCPREEIGGGVASAQCAASFPTCPDRSRRGPQYIQPTMKCSGCEGLLVATGTRTVCTAELLQSDWQLLMGSSQEECASVNITIHSKLNRFSSLRFQAVSRFVRVWVGFWNADCVEDMNALKSISLLPSQSPDLKRVSSTAELKRM